MKQGIERELAKKIQGAIKDAKLKVDSQINGDKLRVTGKKRDDLQAAMALLRAGELRAAAAVRQFPRLSRAPLRSGTTVTTGDDPIALTRRWLERAVIGLNLCPFAKAVYVKQQVRFVLSEARDAEALLQVLRDELLLPARTPIPSRSTPR